MSEQKIPAKDTDELFAEYVKTKDLGIRNQLIEKYLYIAEIAAKKFVGRGVDYEDLYQVASLALVKAIERFEPDREIKFSSFATPSLIGEIKNYFRDSSRVMRLPRRDIELYKKLNKFVEEYVANKGYKPSVKIIAEHLGVPEERIFEVLEMKQADNVMSLDADLSVGENTSLSAVLGKEDESFEQIENHDFLKYCLDLLNDTEKQIIEERYFKNRTQKQVAEILHVSQMQVSRMERKILSKLATAYKK